MLTTRFTGWGKDGDWGDLKFMHENDPYIEKIAVVGNDEWKDQIMMYLGAGRRQASVAFFSPEHLQEAREWLMSKTE